MSQRKGDFSCLLIHRKKTYLMKINKSKKMYITLTILLLTCIIVGVFTLFHQKTAKKVNYTRYDLTDEKDKEKNRKRTKKANYVGETIYDGANVPYILYDEEFISEDDKKILGENVDASDSYFTNKDLVASLGKDQVKEFVDASTSFLKFTFGNNYREIEVDTDSFVNEFLSMYANTSSIGLTTLQNSKEANEEGYMDADVLASKIAEMYVDNSLTLDTKYYSDASLVYYKYYTYFVRGMLEITPTSPEHKTGEACKPLKDLFGIDCKYGESVQVVVETEVAGNKDMGISKVFLYKIAD